MSRFPLILLFIGVISCAKDSPTQLPPLIDPVLLGSWYSLDNFLGFEVHEDGTTTNLVRDNSTHVIRYPMTGDPAARLTLTLTGAESGTLRASVRYVISSTKDTTALIEGLYVVTADKDSLTMTIPDSNGDETSMVFQKALVGAPLVAKDLSLFLPP